MYSDQPQVDPTVARDPTLQLLPVPGQPELQQNATYSIEVPGNIQMETAPPAVSESRLDLTIAGESQPGLKYRFDLPDDYELRELPKYNPYPDVEITDPNILPAPSARSGDEEPSPSKLQHVNENWSGDYGDWGSELQPQESQRSLRPTYRIVTPPILPSRGRGFNPNRAFRWRVPRRVPQFHHEYRGDIACHRCGEYMIFLGTCRNINCGIDVECPSCQDSTDGEGRCQNPGCNYYGHQPDDPKCHDCGAFVSEGKSWCSECQTRYPDSC